MSTFQPLFNSDGDSSKAFEAWLAGRDCWVDGDVGALAIFEAGARWAAESRLEAEVERLRALLATAYRVEDPQAVIATFEQRAEAAEAELASLRPLLEADEAEILRLAQLVNYERAEHHRAEAQLASESGLAADPNASTMDMLLEAALRTGEASTGMVVKEKHCRVTVAVQPLEGGEK